MTLGFAQYGRARPRRLLAADDPEAGVAVEGREPPASAVRDGTVMIASSEPATTNMNRPKTTPFGGVLVVESRAHGRNQGHGAEQDRVRGEVGSASDAGVARDERRHAQGPSDQCRLAGPREVQFCHYRARKTLQKPFTGQLYRRRIA